MGRTPFLSPFFLSFFQIREIAVLRHNFEQRNWVEKQLRNEFIEYLRRHTDRQGDKKEISGEKHKARKRKLSCSALKIAIGRALNKVNMFAMAVGWAVCLAAQIFYFYLPSFFLLSPPPSSRLPKGRKEKMNKGGKSCGMAAKICGGAARPCTGCNIAIVLSRGNAGGGGRQAEEGRGGENRH